MKDSLSKNEIDSFFKDLGNYWEQVKSSDVITKDFNFMSLEDACAFVDQVAITEKNFELPPSKIKFKASLRRMRHGELMLVPVSWGKVSVEIEARTLNHFALAKEIDEIYK